MNVFIWINTVQKFSQAKVLLTQIWILNFLQISKKYKFLSPCDFFENENFAVCAMREWLAAIANFLDLNS